MDHGRKTKTANPKRKRRIGKLQHNTAERERGVGEGEGWKPKRRRRRKRSKKNTVLKQESPERTTSTQGSKTSFAASPFQLQTPSTSSAHHAASIPVRKILLLAHYSVLVFIRVLLFLPSLPPPPTSPPFTLLVCPSFLLNSFVFYVPFSWFCSLTRS